MAFTLAELIVATTLTVMIGGATVGLVRSTAAARALADRDWAMQQEAQSAADAIATALRNAWTDGTERTRLLGRDGWEGDLPADALRLFVVTQRTVRPGAPESDVMECEFRLAGPQDEPADSAEGSASVALLERIDPTLSAEPDGGGVVLTLARSILGLDIQYHDGDTWYDDWPPDRPNLPLAVRVTVVATAPAEEQASMRAPGAPPTWTTSRLVVMPAGRTALETDQSGSAQAPQQEQP